MSDERFPALPGGVLGDTPRFELVRNTSGALQSWGAASGKRRAAVRRLGELLR
jgi:hypothetical protein